MKRTISVLLTLAMVFALAGCVSVKVAENPFEAKQAAEPAVTDAPTEAPTAAPTEAPTEAPTPEPTEEPTPEPTAAPTPTPEPTEVPYKAVAEGASEKLKSIRSFHMDMDLNMDMEMVVAMGELKQGIPMNVRAILEADVTGDPLRLRGNMTVSAVGVSANTLLYGARDGENTVIYTSEDNGATWQQQTDPQGNGMMVSPSEALDLLLKESMEITPTGVQDVNGQPAAVYTGRISGQRIQAILESTGALGEMSEALDVDLSEDALKDMEDMVVTIMIDEESGLPVRYAIDMTAAMKGLMAAALAKGMAGQDMEGVDVGMDVSATLLTVTLSRFDSIDPIVIPEAVLNAPAA